MINFLKEELLEKVNATELEVQEYFTLAPKAIRLIPLKKKLSKYMQDDSVNVPQMHWFEQQEDFFNLIYTPIVASTPVCVESIHGFVLKHPCKWPGSTSWHPRYEGISKSPLSTRQVMETYNALGSAIPYNLELNNNDETEVASTSITFSYLDHAMVKTRFWSERWIPYTYDAQHGSDILSTNDSFEINFKSQGQDEENFGNEAYPRAYYDYTQEWAAPVGMLNTSGKAPYYGGSGDDGIYWRLPVAVSIGWDFISVDTIEYTTGLGTPKYKPNELTNYLYPIITLSDALAMKSAVAEAQRKSLEVQTSSFINFYCMNLNILIKAFQFNPGSHDIYTMNKDLIQSQLVTIATTINASQFPVKTAIQSGGFSNFVFMIVGGFGGPYAKAFAVIGQVVFSFVIPGLTGQLSKEDLLSAMMEVISVVAACCVGASCSMVKGKGKKKKSKKQKDAKWNGDSYNDINSKPQYDENWSTSDHGTDFDDARQWNDDEKKYIEDSKSKPQGPYDDKLPQGEDEKNDDDLYWTPEQVRAQKRKDEMSKKMMTEDIKASNNPVQNGWCEPAVSRTKVTQHYIPITGKRGPDAKVPWFSKNAFNAIVRDGENGNLSDREMGIYKYLKKRNVLPAHSYVTLSGSFHDKDGNLKRFDAIAGTMDGFERRNEFGKHGGKRTITSGYTKVVWDKESTQDKPKMDWPDDEFEKKIYKEDLRKTLSADKDESDLWTDDDWSKNVYDFFEKKDNGGMMNSMYLYGVSPYTSLSVLESAVWENEGYNLFLNNCQDFAGRIMRGFKTIQSGNDFANQSETALFERAIEVFDTRWSPDPIGESPALTHYNRKITNRVVIKPFIEEILPMDIGWTTKMYPFTYEYKATEEVDELGNIYNQNIVLTSSEALVEEAPWWPERDDSIPFPLNDNLIPDYNLDLSEELP
jgi:hypothetical protein